MGTSRVGSDPPASSLSLDAVPIDANIIHVQSIQQQPMVALSELQDTEHLKAMGLGDTLIILGDTTAATQQCMPGDTANLVLCLPEDTVALEVTSADACAASGPWVQAWVQEPAMEAYTLSTLEKPPTEGEMAISTAGEMLLVVDPTEDSVGLAAKSWFNDSVIATQALLNLEAHK
ncbi:uncharacterized protein LOC135370946 [Ornithodoros turicata]|uniref:uncharacterized protein LOC135370946 n=1 Tax=Ornithodoros turicata TaxID=34597 RepID=UPI0031398429